MREHDQFIELIPAYAVGATDADETRAVEAHLRGCPACRALAEEYRALGDVLLFAAPPTFAPAGLTEDLRKKLGQETAVPVRRAGWLDWLRTRGLALGGVALALLLLTNVYWATRVRGLERQARDFVAVTQSYGVTLQVADGTAHADGVVYAKPDSKLALLCVYALPQLEQGQTYQAWLVRDGQRVSAGTFNVNHNGYGALLIDADRPVGEYQQLGITVEPSGGSPAPTTPRIMGGDL